MCLVDMVTFPACGHKEYLFASACSAGYSHEKSSCTVNYHEIRALKDSAPGDFYGRTCYINKLDWLRDGYRHSYLTVIKDAQAMGWTKEDVRGSLTEIEIEMTEAVNEWKLECDRDEGLDDPKQYLQDVAALLSLFSVKPSGPTAKKNLAGDVAAGTFAIPSKTPSTQKLRQANLAVLKRQVFGSPNKVKQMTPLVSSQSSGIAFISFFKICSISCR